MTSLADFGIDLARAGDTVLTVDSCEGIDFLDLERDDTAFLLMHQPGWVAEAGASALAGGLAFIAPRRSAWIAEGLLEKAE